MTELPMKNVKVVIRDWLAKVGFDNSDWEEVMRR
jgi:hypothetical protein